MPQILPLCQLLSQSSFLPIRSSRLCFSATSQKTDRPSTRRSHWFSQSKSKLIFKVHPRNHCHVPRPELPRCPFTLLPPYFRHIQLPVSPTDQTSQHVGLQPHLPPSPVHLSWPPYLVSSSHTVAPLLRTQTSWPSTTLRALRPHGIPHRRRLCTFLMVC